MRLKNAATATAQACRQRKIIRFFSKCQLSDCVTLVRSLLEAGALSTSGLAEIADVWRSFVPVPDTKRRDLRHRPPTPSDRTTTVKHAPAIPHNPTESVPNAFRTWIRKNSSENDNPAILLE